MREGVFKPVPTRIDGRSDATTTAPFPSISLNPMTWGATSLHLSLLSVRRPRRYATIDERRVAIATGRAGILLLPRRRFAIASQRLVDKLFFRRLMKVSTGFRPRINFSTDRLTRVVEISLSISAFTFSSRADTTSAAASEILVAEMSGNRSIKEA